MPPSTEFVFMKTDTGIIGLKKQDSVAELHTKRATTIIDLVDKHAVTDLFTDELLKWKVQLSVLSDRLSYKLSLPVSPSFADRDYKPTQEPCRLIRELQYRLHQTHTEGSLAP